LQCVAFSIDFSRFFVYADSYKTNPETIPSLDTTIPEMSSEPESGDIGLQSMLYKQKGA